MKITREEMLEFMDNLALATVFDQKTGLTVLWNRSGDIPVAIRALIESSPEAGEQRGDVVKVTYTSECPRCGWATERTDILSLDDGYALSAEEVALLRKADPMIEADEQLADSTRPAPLHAEVEAAWVPIEQKAMDFLDVMEALYRKEILSVVGAVPAGVSVTKDFDAALATLRAALTEARQPKVVSRESGHVSPTGGKQQESEMTTEEPK